MMRWFVPLIAGLALLAGCGGSDTATIGTVSPSPDNTETPAASATPEILRWSTPAPPTLKLGTRENPVPIGNPVSYTDGWEIKVVSTTPDADALIAAENQFNKPPKPGNQFFIAHVTAKYSGAASKAFDGSYSLRAVGPSSVSYSTFANDCGVVPGGFQPSAEAFSGGVVEGNVCWEVKSADAAGLVMFYSPFLTNADRIYWKLTP